MRSVAPVVFGLMVLGCGQKYPRDCGPLDPSVTFAEVKPVFEAYCTECHSSTRSGSSRRGAPSSVNYDNFSDASASAEDANRVILGQSMPPSGEVPDAEACLIEAWIAANTPEGVSP